MMSARTPTRLLTTGQAAKLCAVTPDTILKWIRAGRLPAQRTPGGHHRILGEDLESLLVPAVPVRAPAPRAGVEAPLDGLPFQFCWDYYSTDGSLNERCGQCTAYLTRAERCYELARLAPGLGNTGTFCTTSCQDCDYFRRVQESGTRVLVVSDDADLVAELRRRCWRAQIDLEAADCEYTTSAVVDAFRPDFVIVDCGLGPQRSRDIRRHLSEDPRIPFARLILAAGPGELPESCEQDVYAFLAKPFTVDNLVACIAAIGEHAQPTGSSPSTAAVPPQTAHRTEEEKVG